MVNAFGPSELALRLVPFLAGVTLLAVAWDVGRRTLPAPLTPVLVLAVALSPGLIRYSSEVKQYETDALAVLAVLDGALLVAARPAGRVSGRLATAFGALAAMAVLCSHVAALTTFAAVLVLLTHRGVLRTDGACCGCPPPGSCPRPAWPCST